MEVSNTKMEDIARGREEKADPDAFSAAASAMAMAILVNFTEDTVLHGAHCDVLAVRLK